MSGKAKSIGWVMLGFSVLIVLAAFLPWATVLFVTVNGTSGDGGITLVMGLLAGGLAVVRGVARKPSGWQITVPLSCLLLGLLVLAIAVYDINNVNTVGVSIGVGLPLTLVGGVGLAVAAVSGLVVRN